MCRKYLYFFSCFLRNPCLLTSKKMWHRYFLTPGRTPPSSSTPFPLLPSFLPSSLVLYEASLQWQHERQVKGWIHWAHNELEISMNGTTSIPPVTYRFRRCQARNDYARLKEGESFCERRYESTIPIPVSQKISLGPRFDLFHHWIIYYNIRAAWILLVLYLFHYFLANHVCINSNDEVTFSMNFISFKQPVVRESYDKFFVLIYYLFDYLFAWS